MVIFLIVLLLAVPESAKAYLDPGTGSYIFQIAIAAFLGLGYAIKLYWKKIKDFFSKK